MAFTIPQYNLELLVWRSGNTPFADDPDIDDQVCQLYIHNRHNQDITPGGLTSWVPPIILRIPTGFQPIPGDIYGVGGNAITFYKHRWSHLMHWGFPNQYVSVVVEMCDDTGGTGVMHQQL